MNAHPVPLGVVNGLHSYRIGADVWVRGFDAVSIMNGITPGDASAINSAFVRTLPKDDAIRFLGKRGMPRGWYFLEKHLEGLVSFVGDKDNIRKALAGKWAGIAKSKKGKKAAVTTAVVMATRPIEAQPELPLPAAPAPKHSDWKKVEVLLKSVIEVMTVLKNENADLRAENAEIRANQHALAAQIATNHHATAARLARFERKRKPVPFHLAPRPRIAALI